MNKVILSSVLIIVLIGVFLLFNKPATAMAYDGKVTVYKSMSCGCCSAYASWLQKLKLDVEIVDMDDVASIKEKYNIPVNMRSCHTTFYGDYIVEGHIPIEAVKKLLDEKPNIKGIAMPGMPSGSPGMPGSKEGQFVIYALENDGSTNVFMRM